MMESRIKICGITGPEDASSCHRLGADYLGVIFAESPRKVTRGKAAEIRNAVPNARLVGVFADGDVDAVTETARSCMLNMIQLHGDESSAYCADLHARTMLPIVKAFRMGAVPGPDGLAAYGAVKFFLLDQDKGEPRTGRVFAKLLEQAARMVKQGFRLFLAGGLSPENVRLALERVSPFGVDVCSGVEEKPGVKDLDGVSRFIAEVRGCPPVKE
jgi:phosphoribosylanthranilate isomerase